MLAQRFFAAVRVNRSLVFRSTFFGALPTFFLAALAGLATLFGADLRITTSFVELFAARLGAPFMPLRKSAWSFSVWSA